jgi:orotate phosphoribosyltransferase
VQYVQTQLGMRVCSVATLADLLAYLKTQDDPEVKAHEQAVAAYRTRYGV